MAFPVHPSKVCVDLRLHITHAGVARLLDLCFVAAGATVLYRTLSRLADRVAATFAAALFIGWYFNWVGGTRRSRTAGRRFYSWPKSSREYMEDFPAFSDYVQTHYELVRQIEHFEAWRRNAAGESDPNG